MTSLLKALFDVSHRHAVLSVQFTQTYPSLREKKAIRKSFRYSRLPFLFLSEDLPPKDYLLPCQDLSSPSTDKETVQVSKGNMPLPSSFRCRCRREKYRVLYRQSLSLSLFPELKALERQQSLQQSLLFSRSQFELTLELFSSIEHFSVRSFLFERIKYLKTQRTFITCITAVVNQRKCNM